MLGDDGYEWRETTNVEDAAAGKRTFVRGAPLDKNVAALAQLRGKLLKLADEYECNPKWLRSLDVCAILKELAK
ncbi:MAG: hypothetical protein ABW022_17725 [Actinoplanes sp.]